MARLLRHHIRLIGNSSYLYVTITLYIAYRRPWEATGRIISARVRLGCLEREIEVESRLWTEFYIRAALSFNCRQSLILQARTIKNPAIYADLVGAVGIEHDPLFLSPAI